MTRPFVALTLAGSLLAGAATAQVSINPIATPVIQQPSSAGTVQFGQLDSQNTNPLTGLIGSRAFVWNAQNPVGSTYFAYPYNTYGALPGVAMSFYMPCCRDPVPGISGSYPSPPGTPYSNPHTYLWFLRNHPDWLVWTSQSANASPTVATTTSGHTTTLPVSDTTNIILGSAAVATGIPNLTFVTAITAGTPPSVTLSAETTATITSGTTVNFWYPVQVDQGDNVFDVNIQASDVRQYLLNYAKFGPVDLPGGYSSGLFSGYNYLALDNLAPDNLQNVAGQAPLNIVGHYAGTVTSGCSSGPPSCGLTWAPLYSGAEVDPTFLAAQVSYLQWLRSNLNANGAGLAGNVKVDKNNVQGAIQLAQNTDLFLMESPFLHGCATDGSGNQYTNFQDQSDGQWAGEVQVAAAVGPLRPMYQLGYLCGNSVRSTADPISNAETSWGVGNYLLTRGPQTLMSVNNVSTTSLAPQKDLGYLLAYPQSMAPAVGYPTEPPPSTINAPLTAPSGTSSPCYERTFSTGLVEVWPYPTNSTGCTYTVPSGTWTDNFGNSVSVGTNILYPDTSLGISNPRANAIILVRTG
jgi:hypothetical protein